MSIVLLKDKVLNEAKRTAASRSIAERLHEIYKGDIETEVKASLYVELSPKSYLKAIQRIPDINTIKKIVDKLSRVYVKPAVRQTENETDKNLIQEYSKLFKIDSLLKTANKVLNWGKYLAFEPFVSTKGEVGLRILLPYQCFAINDDINDPRAVSAVVKIMSPLKKEDPDTKQSKVVEVFHVFTESEFMILHSDGDIVGTMSHTRKRIPILFVNPDEFDLNPESKEWEINSAVLIPKAYADLYYAAQYTTHSMTVTRDVTLPKDPTYSPDAILETTTADIENAQPSIEVIQPKADIEGILTLIKDTLFFMLDSKGIKPRDSGSNIERPNAAFEIIDTADASSAILDQCMMFSNIETDLWNLIKDTHNVWVKSPSLKIPNRSTFSDKFAVNVSFNEIKPVELRKELLERIEKQMQMGLMSEEQALTELYPHFTESQRRRWLKEIEKERETKRQQNEVSQNQGSGLPDQKSEGSTSEGHNRPDQRENAQGS